ncbi:sarcoplasmic calcium-binding protein-like isoform X3 [Ruditapes philippinarum]|uniref:sarcoplasmic calcium-binding protein-like isoform X3 n=1 Tax=Ruditapes philippinarum TaxID=129788 RepID=UPI00295ADE16|nr:sarcoplasmic calcium-binding protein-like isoform X3 [Ruditapes philippinarum]
MAANDFLVSKWKIWYKSLDVNHDGTISMEDVEESRQKFSELHHLDAEKKKMVMENFEKWWNEYVFRGKKGEVSETQFIEALQNDYKADKNKFKKQMEKCFDTIFDVIDTNKDRSISEDEFLIAFEAYGHENVALDTKFFKAYNPVDGLVPLKDIVASWVDFATSSDASKPSVVKTAFEAGV